MIEKYFSQQKALCEKYHSLFCPPMDEMIIGISRNVKDGILPINGLRHPIQGKTCGWYIWAGEELSDDPDFFVSLHLSHIEDWCPMIIKYLGLSPGWKFLSDGEYEDVWYDENLLNI